VNDRLLVVIQKEFREYRRNRFILLTMAGMPVVLLLILAAETFALPKGISDAALRRPIGTALLFLQLIPVMLPTTIAAYAVIGEREQMTLEPVLTTPVTDSELLAGKAIAAVLPAVAISWLLFGVYVGLAQIFAPAVVVSQIWTAEQGVAMALLAPALAGFAILVGIVVSLRSSDFRVAQQVAVLASVPVIAFVALITFRILDPSVGLYVAAATIVFVLDAACWRLALRLFNRERLLTVAGTAR
jgi:ABC-type transport system involved in multi-copper enzyme maturation permease subunit